MMELHIKDNSEKEAKKRHGRQIKMNLEREVGSKNESKIEKRGKWGFRINIKNDNNF